MFARRVLAIVAALSCVAHVSASVVDLCPQFDAGTLPDTTATCETIKAALLRAVNEAATVSPVRRQALAGIEHRDLKWYKKVWKGVKSPLKAVGNVVGSLSPSDWVTIAEIASEVVRRRQLTEVSGLFTLSNFTSTISNVDCAVLDTFLHTLVGEICAARKFAAIQNVPSTVMLNLAYTDTFDQLYCTLEQCRVSTALLDATAFVHDDEGLCTIFAAGTPLELASSVDVTEFKYGHGSSLYTLQNTASPSCLKDCLRAAKTFYQNFDNFANCQQSNDKKTCRLIRKQTYLTNQVDCRMSCPK